MRAVHLVVRGFRNLADLELELPPEGAAFLGPNGRGKTNLLEALYYPVLCRSFRGASDGEVARWDGPGFRVGLDADLASPIRLLEGDDGTLLRRLASLFDRKGEGLDVEYGGRTFRVVEDRKAPGLAVRGCQLECREELG